MAQWVKNLSAMQETREAWVQSLSQEDPLEKETTTHSSILAWEIPWMEEPGGLQSMKSQESDMTERLNWTEPRIIRNGLEIERNTVDLVTEKWATNLNAYET